MTQFCSLWLYKITLWPLMEWEKNCAMYTFYRGLVSRMYKELRKTPFRELVKCPSPPSLGRREGRNSLNVRTNNGSHVVLQMCGGNSQLEGNSWMTSPGMVTREGFTRKTAKSKRLGRGQQAKPEEPTCSKCLLVMIKVYESHQSRVGHTTVPEPNAAGLSTARTTKPWAVPGCWMVTDVWHTLLGSWLTWGTQ